MGLVNLLQHTMKHILLLLAFLFNKINGECNIEPPVKAKGAGPALGLIFVPGAKIKGASYLPLLRQVQSAYPGSLWIGTTNEWLGDMPNPIEIGGQITDCLLVARAQNLDVSNMFYGGHSLGGVVLQNYLSGNSDAAKGMVLLGTWLPDLLRADNEFPIPVLTAIGELDGGGISYLRREWEETQVLSEQKRMLTKTILVPQVNHAQVASGEVPASVVDNDIDGELAEENAHRNYAMRVADWLVMQVLESTERQDAVKNFMQYEMETTEFLDPFIAMRDLEQTLNFSPFTIESQKNLLNTVPDNLDVSNEIIDVVSFEVKQPYIEEDSQTGVLRVKTLSYLTYDFDVLDFNNHLSASTIKAKLKSADSIYSTLNLPETGEFLSCAELNRMSLDVAKSVASSSAISRMESRGRSLNFVKDVDMVWGGLPWENTGGLTWTENSAGSVDLQATRITSGVDFPFYSGLHYCDVLSPYRALEWIYIESIRHVMQF